MELSTLTELMYHLSCSSDHNYPGNTTTKGLEVALGLVVAIHLDEDVDLYELLTDDNFESDSMYLGKAFAAALMRNQGNRYASQVVASVLTRYNGQEVTQELGRLLNMLENYLLKNGDAQKAGNVAEH